MLIEIDVWLLRKLEKFSHWFQKLTGKNCFWLARVATACYFCFGLAVTAFYILSKETSMIILYSLSSLIILAVAISMFKMLKFKEEIVLDASNIGLVNPFKILDYPIRTLTLIFTPICSFREIAGILDGGVSIILVFIGIFGNLLFWYGLFYYFSACDPLPPAKSKVKEWKEKFVNAVKGVFAPVPRPVPAPCE